LLASVCEIGRSHDSDCDQLIFDKILFFTKFENIASCSPIPKTKRVSLIAVFDESDDGRLSMQADIHVLYRLFA